jgi:transposase, IS30 family
MIKVGHKRLRASALHGWTPPAGRLSAEEREDILVGLKAGKSMSAIARELGRAPSTVTREVAANGGPTSYGAWRGLCRARALSRRPKTAKLCHRPLVVQVTTWLELCWSPEEIAHRLRVEFKDDPMMQVSYETIYQSLFVQGRGELRRELVPAQRTGQTPAPGQHGASRTDSRDGHDLRAPRRRG